MMLVKLILMYPAESIPATELNETITSLLKVAGVQKKLQNPDTRINYYLVRSIPDDFMSKGIYWEKVNPLLEVCSMNFKTQLIEALK